jgi:HTH-type transcriptional regulator/antitoxin HipB
VDDVRIGRILRALRRRRRLTQAQLGARAGVSQQTISLIERGHGSKLAGDTLRRVFAALDARWEPVVSWRGGALDRLLDEAHAELVGETVRRLQAAGWDVAVETTYSVYGERGSIDVLAGRQDRQALIVVEVKSDLTVIEATIRKMDEKERIVRRSLGRERFGFRPAIVGRILVLPATDTARRRVRRSSAVLDVAFPARSREIR